MQSLAGVAQYLGGAPVAGLGDRAQHPRCAQLRVLGDRRIDALGRERDEHVLADAQATLGERLGQQLARGADVGRRGQHERLPGTRVRDDRSAGVAQQLRVGTTLVIDRSRHADQHEIRGAHRVDAVGEDEALALEVLAQLRLLALEQLGTALADLRQTGAGGVDADDPRARAAQRDGGRQPDVAEADDRDDGLLDRDHALAERPLRRLRARCPLDQDLRVGALDTVLLHGCFHRQLRRHRCSLRHRWLVLTAALSRRPALLAVGGLPLIDPSSDPVQVIVGRSLHTAARGPNLFGHLMDWGRRHVVPYGQPALPVVGR